MQQRRHDHTCEGVWVMPTERSSIRSRALWLKRVWLVWDLLGVQIDDRVRIVGIGNVARCSASGWTAEHVHVCSTPTASPTNIAFCCLSPSSSLLLHKQSTSRHPQERISFPSPLPCPSRPPAPPVQAILATRHTDRQDRIVVPAQSIINTLHLGSISQQLQVRRKPLPPSCARPTRLRIRFLRPR